MKHITIHSNLILKKISKY